MWIIVAIVGGVILLLAIVALVVVIVLVKHNKKKSKRSFGHSDYPYASFDDHRTPLNNPTMETGGGFVYESAYKAY